MIRIVFVCLVIIHGLIHLMGFVKAFRLAEVNQFALSISRPAGLLWLLAGLLFIVTVVVFLFKKDWWWMTAVPALMLSQLLIIWYWQAAKFGTIANIIILLVTVIDYGNWNFTTTVRNELRSFKTSVIPGKEIVTAEMIAGLPPVVQTWLQRANITGKEIFQSVYLKQSAVMRTAPDGKWMPVQAEQWFRTQNPGFIWVADVEAGAGIYLAGRDKFENGKGHILIKLLSLFPVADKKGSEIDQGTMLRYMAEIIWFPSAACMDYLKWEQMDSVSAKVTMTYGGISTSGLIRFDVHGDMVSFEAKRYYDRKEGATLEDWFIQVDPDGYREFQGVRIPARSSVTWKFKEGDFTWFRLEITGIKYNEPTD